MMDGAIDERRLVDRQSRTEVHTPPPEAAREDAQHHRDVDCAEDAEHQALPSRHPDEDDRLVHPRARCRPCRDASVEAKRVWSIRRPAAVCGGSDLNTACNRVRWILTVLLF